MYRRRRKSTMIHRHAVKLKPIRIARGHSKEDYGALNKGIGIFNRGIKSGWKELRANAQKTNKFMRERKKLERMSASQAVSQMGSTVDSSMLLTPGQISQNIATSSRAESTSPTTSVSPLPMNPLPSGTTTTGET